MRILRQRLGAVCMFLMLVLAVSACDQTTSLEPERPSFKAHLHPSLNNTDEGDALVKAAELLARSLEDDAVRQAVKNHMRASPYNEHKLEFRSYLVSQDGGPLLAAMAREYAAETADVLALLARIRPLELYMPVVEHRLTWTGDPDVVVAGLLEDHTIPAGFTVTGEFHQFTSAEEAPDVPTLSLVPVETNFSRVPDRGAFRNVDQAAGEAIGVWEPLSVKKSEDDCGPYAIRECDSGGTSGGGIDWSIRPTGLWMTKAYIPDDHEGGFKGAPEFETHLQSPPARSFRSGRPVVFRGGRNRSLK